MHTQVNKNKKNKKPPRQFHFNLMVAVMFDWVSTADVGAVQVVLGDNINTVRL